MFSPEDYQKNMGTPSIYYWDDIGVNIILEYLPANIEELITKTIRVLDDNLKETVRIFLTAILASTKPLISYLCTGTP